MAWVLRREVRDRCEQISLQTRGELSLAAEDRLDPRILAEHLGIEMLSLAAFSENHPDAVRQLMETTPKVFSAAMVPFEDRLIIVFNPTHSPRRHVNTISHELAHFLLAHKPEPLFDRSLKRRWDPEEEAEADYLAGALLVPKIAVVSVMKRYSNGIERAAEHFGVSESLMQARIEAALANEPSVEAGLAEALGTGEAAVGAAEPTRSPFRLRRIDVGAGERKTSAAPPRA